MIVDKFDNIEFYKDILPNLDAALLALKDADKKDLGRYEFEGGFFMIQEGQTKPLEEGTFEAHRKYIDVQIILEGSEEVAWKEIGDLKTEVHYDEENDVERFEGSKDNVILISKGMFYAGFPHDGHKPVSHTKAQQNFRKIVLKLPVK